MKFAYMFSALAVAVTLTAVLITTLPVLRLRPAAPDPYGIATLSVAQAAAERYGDD
ncbi:glycoprotein-polysaccharide metabolism [Klebsiella aerogenes]|nr:glycoprotein-polysaccharide metabolism [Klebsiella aerogenes]